MGGYVMSEGGNWNYYYKHLTLHIYYLSSIIHHRSSFLTKFNFVWFRSRVCLKLNWKNNTLSLSIHLIIHWSACHFQFLRQKLTTSWLISVSISCIKMNWQQFAWWMLYWLLWESGDTGPGFLLKTVSQYQSKLEQQYRGG